MSQTGSEPATSNRLASKSRTAVRKAPGVVPVARAKTRARWNGLTNTSAASRLGVIGSAYRLRMAEIAY